MKILDTTKFAARALSSRKTMATLTILGIVIGPATIVSLNAATQGFSNASAAQFQKLGATTIFVNTGFTAIGTAIGGGSGPVLQSSGAGGARHFNLTHAAVSEIQALKGVSGVLPYDQLSGSLTVGGVSESLQVIALNVAELTDFIPSLTLQQGSLPSGGSGAVVGYSVAYPGSGATSNLTINKVITVTGIQSGGSGNGATESFLVKGIYASFGASYSLINPDQSIFVPLSVGESIKGNYNDYDGILVKATNSTVVNRLISEIDKLFNNEVSASAASSILSALKSISGSTTTLLEAIAGISVLVAFIGIMTTMFTSVLERTREIGLVKALGATGRNILLTFLFEALLTGLIGGVIGASAGAGLSFLVIILLQGGSGIPGVGGGTSGVTITPAITPELLFSVIALASVVGMVAGLYPAWRASKMPPVDALRAL